MTRLELSRIGRFVALNGVGTCVDVGLVFLLRHELSAPWLLAVFAGWSSSVVIGFVLNRRFVFADGRTTLFIASSRYLSLVVFNFAVGVGGVTLLVSHGWNYVLTRLLSSTLLVIINFYVSRWWVFAVPASAAGESASHVDAFPLPLIEAVHDHPHVDQLPHVDQRPHPTGTHDR